MEISIVGFPNSSKTTIYNALTKGDIETRALPSGALEVHTSVVDVPDVRVDLLSKMFQPRKTTRAQIVYNDLAGISRDKMSGRSLPDTLLNRLRQSEALMHVVRAFHDEAVPAQDGVDPARDVGELDVDLILADLAVVERRLERLGKKRDSDPREAALLQRLQASLEEGIPLRDMDLKDEEWAALRGYCFLSAKPMLLVLNVGDNGSNALQHVFEYDHRQSAAITLQGQLEAEIARLDEEDARDFLAEYQIEEPTLNRVVRASYELLGLQSFFTVGEDEVRAWTIRRGATAQEAASVIHTDLARGFIRAEVINYHDLMDAGSLAEAKARGKMRLCKKDYIVQDGDILNIRFAL
jgi:GTP-binding protein YchF